MIRRFILSLALMAVLLCAPCARAQEFSIAATVNGEPVTNYMLRDRVNAMVAAGRLENTAETRKKVSFQALQTIINEILQQQDAERAGVGVSPEEVDKAIADMRGRNNLGAAQFEQFLARQGLSKDTFRQQVQAQLLWRKVAARKIAPRLFVSDEEVNEQISQLANRKELREVLLSEIVMPAAGGHEEKALEMARQLTRKLRGGEASFKDLAAQFSSGSTAGDGGRIGWIQVEQLRGDLREALSRAKAGDITEPVEGDGVYRIFRIDDARASDTKPDAAAVREMILAQKMELEARRYIKELRQQAVIDIRQ